MSSGLLSRKGFWIFFLLFNLTVLPVLFFFGRQVSGLRSYSGSAEALPVHGTLRAFSLKDADGRPFELGDMKKRVWVANFMFTSCPNECPAMNFKMGLLQGKLPGSPGLLSFSVDPERDTSEVLAGYAEKFKAQRGNWYFLTGSQEVIGRLLEDCHFPNTGNPVLHGLRLVLIDEQGRIRGYYDYSDESMIAKLTNDIKRLKAKG